MTVITTSKEDDYIYLMILVKVKVKSISRVRLSATPWTAAYQAPQSMAFSRQEYWSRVPLPTPPECITESKIYNSLPKNQS